MSCSATSVLQCNNCSERKWARQVCHTGGLWEYLPSFLQRASSPIVEVVVDDARYILYARTAASEVRHKPLSETLLVSQSLDTYTYG